MNLLLASALKASLIVLVALVAVRALRRRSSAVRHWVLAAAIVSASAVPALEAIVPAWQLPVFSSSDDSWIGEPLTLVSARLSGVADGPVEPPAVERGLAALVGRLAGPAWAAGAALNVLVLLAGLCHLAWLASRSTRVRRGPWAVAAEDLSRRAGLGRPVRLLQSDHPSLLVTWGLLQPKVMLPAAARDWTDERIHIVLAHELAHIRRRDWLVQLTAELLRSIYWFNPLTWIACRRLRQESEEACDDEVLRGGVKGPVYAAVLVDLARDFTRHRHAWAPAPAIAHRSSLERRVRAMLNVHLNRAPATRAVRAITAVALAAVTIPLAGFGVARAAESPVVVPRLEGSRAAPTTPGGGPIPVLPRPAGGAVQQTGAAPGEALATLSGTVRDELGGLIPDVDVSLTLINGQGRLTARRRTDETGSFEFAGLPPWRYELTAQVPGFVTHEDVVTLAAGQRLTWDLTMAIGSIVETVSVVGGAGATPEPAVTDEAQVRRARLFLESQRDADPCLRSTSGGCLRPPVKLRNVAPHYPPDLQAAGIQGVVVLEGVIGTNGFIAAPRERSSAHSALVAAAAQAVANWEFAPTRLNGVPVDTSITVTVDFRIQE
jgi:TonB family protein